VFYVYSHFTQFPRKADSDRMQQGDVTSAADALLDDESEIVFLESRK